jgi:hypothetical protein
MAYRKKHEPESTSKTRTQDFEHEPEGAAVAAAPADAVLESDPASEIPGAIDQTEGTPQPGEQLPGAADANGQLPPAQYARRTATLNYQGRIEHKGVEFLPGVETAIPDDWTEEDIYLLRQPVNVPPPSTTGKQLARLRTKGKILVTQGGRLLVAACDDRPIDISAFDLSQAETGPIFTITGA